MIKSRIMRWARNFVQLGKKKNAYRILMGKPEGKRPLGRPRCRWVDYSKLGLRKIGWGDMYSTGLSQDRDL
jgi:hypothetical protein